MRQNLNIYTFTDPIIIQSKGGVKRKRLTHLSKIAMLCRICYTKDAALLHSGNRREVSRMVQILTDIIVAVIAQVIADRLCKWLDNYRKGQ